MGLIEQIIARAKSNKQRIVLPEAAVKRRAGTAAGSRIAGGDPLREGQNAQF